MQVDNEATGESISDVAAVIIRVLWRQPTRVFSCHRLSKLTAFPAGEVQAAVDQLHEDRLVTLFHAGRGPVVALAATREAREHAICAIGKRAPASAVPLAADTTGRPGR
jgi:hypothetical protein